MSNSTSTTNIIIVDLTVPEIIDLTTTPRRPRRHGRLLPPSMAARIRRERLQSAMEAINLTLAMSSSDINEDEESEDDEDSEDDDEEEDDDDDEDLQRALQESHQDIPPLTPQQARKRCRESNTDMCHSCLYPIQFGTNNGFCDECA